MKAGRVFDVKLETVWEVVRQHLGPLRSALDALLALQLEVG